MKRRRLFASLALAPALFASCTAAAATLKDALTQLRMAFVQLHEPAAGDGEPEEG